MARCVHCWHEFESDDAQAQARVRGDAWVRKMTRLAGEMASESDSSELSLVFCCKCGESRFDHRRVPVLRAFRG